tara:strand:+ start:6641 stop:7129 length:489 start_codon:yes stop_codon:yes gene_type:complete
MAIYNNSCIYKITCNNSNVKDSYIGSTTNFESRMVYHKSRCSIHNNLALSKLYLFIIENGGWENWTMEKIKECNFETKNELLEQEKLLINAEENPVLNMIRPIRTAEEHKEQKRLLNFKNQKKNQAYQKIKKQCQICLNLRSRSNFAKHRRLCEKKDLQNPI